MKVCEEFKVTIALEAEKGNKTIVSLAKKFKVNEDYVINCRDQLIWGSNGLFGIFTSDCKTQIKRPNSKRPNFDD